MIKDYDKKEGFCSDDNLTSPIPCPSKWKSIGFITDTDIRLGIVKIRKKEKMSTGGADTHTNFEIFHNSDSRCYVIMMDENPVVAGEDSQILSRMTSKLKHYTE